MRKRARWETAFGSFVEDFTVPRLCLELEAHGAPVTASSVFKWVSGECSPRPSHACVIVAVSGGRVSFEDLYRQRSEVQRGSAADQRRMAQRTS